MLDKPTPLLNKYFEAAVSASPEKVKKVFEQLVAQSWRVIPILVEVFINRINRPGAKHAFESAFINSTTTQIDLHRLKEIRDIRSLIIWGKNDNLIPVERDSKLFGRTIENSVLEIVEDAGHAPFAEKPAIFPAKYYMNSLKSERDKNETLDLRNRNLFCAVSAVVIVDSSSAFRNSNWMLTLIILHQAYLPEIFRMEDAKWDSISDFILL